MAILQIVWWKTFKYATVHCILYNIHIVCAVYGVYSYIQFSILNCVHTIQLIHHVQRAMYFIVRRTVYDVQWITWHGVYYTYIAMHTVYSVQCTPFTNTMRRPNIHVHGILLNVRHKSYVPRQSRALMTIGWLELTFRITQNNCKSV